MLQHNPNDIISWEARRKLALCARFVDDESVKMQIVEQCFRHFPIDLLVIAAFWKINWTEWISIRELQPLFGLIRQHARVTKLVFPRQLDELLRKDGFGFDEGWKLVDLRNL